jgi:hypothetical protein
LPSKERGHLAGFQYQSAWRKLPKLTVKHHINKQYQIDKSPDTRRWRAPIWPAPINAFPQHCQLR